jgi:hypothetical protein
MCTNRSPGKLRAARAAPRSGCGPMYRARTGGFKRMLDRLPQGVAWVILGYENGNLPPR